MEFVRNFPLLTIILSLVSSVLCTLLSGRAAKRYTVILETLLILMAGAVLAYTIRSGTSFTYVMGEFPAPWGNEIRAGVLEALMAVMLLTVLLCGVQGGWRFLELDVEQSKHNLYFSLVNLFTAALMALIWTNDIFTGYVFLEIMTLASCGLIVAREIGRTTLAAVRYMILNLLGSGLFLLGVVMLYNLTGHLLMVPMAGAVSELVEEGAQMPLTFSLAMITIGLGIKSGMFPFYFWMPDTYGASTATSAVILSSLVSKAYIFLLFKILFRAIGAEVYVALPIRAILLLLGVLGMAAGSVSAIRSGSLNRMVAYSSAAQIGYIFMGLGLGTEAGFTAALFQILAHAVTKSLLFLTTPRLSLVSGDSMLFQRIQGSGRRAKDAGVFFTVAALSMVGIPVFAGFSAKLLFAVAAVETGRPWVILAVMAALGVSSVLNVLYFIRTVIRIYAKPQDAGPEEPYPVPKELRRQYRVSAAVLTGLNLFLGLFSWVTANLIRQGLSMFG
ncbi:MAG: sodium:proton antiporter [Oscillospiraceae bacterium]|nr:sodium:proton antiporter [Oscillospiraceae bacterium]